MGIKGGRDWSGKQKVVRLGLLAAFLSAAVFALSGCVSVDGLVEKARSYGDTKAEVVKAANCAVSLGGMIRGYTAEERAAGEVLCRGSMEGE